MLVKMYPGANEATVDILNKTFIYALRNNKITIKQIKTEPCPQIISCTVHVEEYSKNINQFVEWAFVCQKYNICIIDILQNQNDINIEYLVKVTYLNVLLMT